MWTVTTSASVKSTRTLTTAKVSGSKGQYIGTGSRRGAARKAREVAVEAVSSSPSSPDVADAEVKIEQEGDARQEWYKKYDNPVGESYVIPFFRGNYKAVREEVDAECVVVSGAIPEDFPDGTYVRNGPNPAFDRAAEIISIGPFSIGRAAPHWFEGDGMLHAAEFSRGKPVRYRNRYVRTEGLEKEFEAGRPKYYPLIDTDPGAMMANAVRTIAENGLAEPSPSAVTKNAANTSVLSHGGRVFALFEAGRPTEITTDLETIGEFDFGGKLDFNFTAHPKLDPSTGELVFFGTNMAGQPYCRVGVVDSQGNLSQKMDIDGIDAPSLMHDFAITGSKTVIIEVPINMKSERMLSGANPLAFEAGKGLRFGVLPRTGPSSSIKWFDAAPGMIFHTVNAYDEEDGQVVVVRAMRADSATIQPPSGSDEDYKEWLVSEFTSGKSNMCSFYEWRLDLRTGSVEEKCFPSAGNLLEFPTINPAFSCRENRYSYCACVSKEVTEATGAALYGSFVKFDHMSGETQTHYFPPNCYGGEAQFVPRKNSSQNAEDDGFLVTYVHDERTALSYLHIIDASDVAGEAVAVLSLPQRVPYGLHGTWIQSL